MEKSIIKFVKWAYEKSQKQIIKNQQKSEQLRAAILRVYNIDIATKAMED